METKRTYRAGEETSPVSSSAEYRVEQPLYPTENREQVLHSAYFQCVASTADSIIMAGGLSPDPEDNEQLIEMAIAFTDKLIEKVGEKL